MGFTLAFTTPFSFRCRLWRVALHGLRWCKHCHASPRLQIMNQNSAREIVYPTTAALSFCPEATWSSYSYFCDIRSTACVVVPSYYMRTSLKTPVVLFSDGAAKPAVLQVCDSAATANSRVGTAVETAADSSVMTYYVQQYVILLTYCCTYVHTCKHIFLKVFPSPFEVQYRVQYGVCRPIFCFSFSYFSPETMCLVCATG